MRYLLVGLVLISFFAVGSTTTFGAQGRGGGRAHGPKTTAVHGPKTTTPRGPKTTTPRGPKAKAAGPKTTSRPASGAARGKKTTATPPTSPTVATNSALPKNPRLVERLRTLLPAGTDMTTAASGFKNQGQFVAAVHVSNNLGLSFADLKTRMVDQGMSLGQSIQQLRPHVDADDAARRATRQAERDLADRTPGRSPRR